MSVKFQSQNHKYFTFGGHAATEISVRKRAHMATKYEISII